MKQRTRPMRATSTEQAVHQPSTCERTAVIILSQVVVIVALLVAWSIFRSRQNQG